MSTALDTLLAWLKDRRNAPDFTTLGMVEAKVRELQAAEASQSGGAGVLDGGGNNAGASPTECREQRPDETSKGRSA